MIKKAIRKCFGIRKNESFSDGVNRHYYHIKKKLVHKKVSMEVLNEYLDELGIHLGDVLIVHSSWRAMYMIDATPEGVLDLLIKKVGCMGNIIMPCYGEDDSFFDVKNTKSSAGVLSELLRKKTGSERSVFPKFSMVAYGKDAFDIVKNHVNSKYQFDENSPYSIATHKYNAKVLLIGLGKSPHKISVFHCASYDSRNTVPYYSECYSNTKSARIVTECGESIKVYVDRLAKYQNNKKVFKKLFKKVSKETKENSGLVLTVFNSNDAYNVAKEYCELGGKIYKIIER